jgi:uncharacterized protein (DUF2147 family)
LRAVRTFKEVVIRILALVAVIAVLVGQSCSGWAGIAADGAREVNPALAGSGQSGQAGSAQAGPAVRGLWLTQGRGGVIAIAPCGELVCARIVGVFLDHPNDPMPVDYRGVSQCGLPLITDAREVRAGLWKGHILDARNGAIFGVELWLRDAEHLALRGFVGISLLGRTEDWTRYTGSVPADCRMTAAKSSR